MSTEGLTPEQQAFLDKCSQQFVDRFTVADPDYKRIADGESPAPPIMCPWYGRAKAVPRYRGHGSRHGHNRYDHRGDSYQDRRNNFY